MSGQDLAQALPQLSGDDRARALTSYLDVATQIGTIQPSNQRFGEILFPDGPIQRDTWSQFLWDRARQTLAISRGDLLQDVPQLDRLLADFYTRLTALEPMTTKALVHGDYFPGNVFIDDTCTVYGVGDFGYSTVVGDARMDVAAAIIFIEAMEGYQAADTQLLLRELSTRAPHIGPDILDLYRLYYSFYFSHCKEGDPRTYWACVRSLRSFV